VLVMSRQTGVSFSERKMEKKQRFRKKFPDFF
jgi:hypothetical protein